MVKKLNNSFKDRIGGIAGGIIGGCIALFIAIFFNGFTLDNPSSFSWIAGFIGLCFFIAGLGGFAEVIALLAGYELFED